jgi:uncharacterized protein YyaL (SSP411 family)
VTVEPPRNRLGDQSSPYLLQHAGNPVCWWPWCDEALTEARRRDVPILISIGYATCYWCHVMERECFEDPRIAAVINEHVVPIKIDREQRPDLDDVHMTACQIFTRLTEGRASGGWPLNAFLHPHTLEPFFVGTYFPPRPMHGRPSFPDLVVGLSEAWRARRDEVDAQASRIGALVRAELSAPAERVPLDPRLGSMAFEGLLRHHDPAEGGFGGAPKFPQPVYLELLQSRDADPRALAALRRTLDRISVGGIHDHLGGGIHRYAVDGTWTVPHFEKMLYDQAQLASVLATHLARHPDPWLERMLRRLVAYLEREMLEPDGCLRSAQDAEVDAREGASFVWTPEEIDGVLSAEDAAFARSIFGIDAGPNFRDPHHPEDRPRNVLRLRDRIDDPAAIERLDRISETLRAARDTRPQPSVDDKILTSWNGLAITGLATAGAALGDPTITALAVRIADAVIARLWLPDGLRRTARGTRIEIDAFLEDHAHLAEGMLALHAATNDPRWLEHAERLVAEARTRFRDEASGLWFDTPDGRSDLLVRACQIVDGAVPSGGGTVMRVLATLAERTGEARHLEDLESFLAAMSATIREHPAGAIRAVLAHETLARLAPDRAERLARAGEVAGQIGGDDGDADRGDDGVRARLHPEATPMHAILRLAVPAGSHILAHDQPDADTALSVLELDATGGTVDVDWPAGRAWRDGLRIHTGLVEVPIRLRRPSPDATIVLVARWQTCDDARCFRPREVEFAIRADAWPGATGHDDA